MKFIYISLFFSLTLFLDLNGEIVKRAAFDFGSGKIKIQVADVDNESHQIIQTLYNNSEVVLLSDDLGKQPDGKFSIEIQEKVFGAAKKFKKEALDLGATEFSGIATEAYRKALNGNELISRYKNELGIHVEIIEQEDEGKFGFLALIEEKKLNKDNVVCWDIGGGSFQVTYLDEKGRIKVYMGPFGRTTTKNAVIENIKKQNPQTVNSPNPMNLSEWNAALEYFAVTLPEAPSELLLKLKNPDVNLIGIAAHPEKLRILETYSKKEILQVLERRLNKADTDLVDEHATPSIAVSELALVHSVITKLDKDHVLYMRTTSGSTSGLLVAEEYWQD